MNRTHGNRRGRRVFRGTGPVPAAVVLLWVAALAGMSVGASPTRQERQSGSGTQGVADYIYVPAPDVGVASLPARERAQRATVDQFRVRYQFAFTDRLPESGITFVHRIVDDAGLTYKPVHYDHGNGIVAADVDADGLEDIYFVNQRGGSELWKNLGGGRFRDITGQAGVALADRIGATASFADVDNDGDQDLFVTTVRGGNALFENDGRGRFTDITVEAGLAYVGHSSGAVFFDYDGDGLLDLYLCNIGRFTNDKTGSAGQYEGLEDAFGGHLDHERSEPSILYRNLGNRRFAVVQDAGLSGAGWNGDATFADLNGDGRPDLYVANMQGDDHYFENAGGRSFVDRTSQYFPRTPWGSMGLKFFDYDNDGRPDLLLTDMHSDMSVQVGPDQEKRKSDIQFSDEYLQGGANNIFGNALFHNLADGRFDEISDRLGLENYWPWGPSVGDLNADGWQDVFIAASMNYPFRYGINSLLLNNRGEKFLDSEFLLGIEPRRDGRTHTEWYHVDCPSAHRLCENRGPGRVTILATVGTRSSVIFDLDHDGDLDIVTNEFNSEPQVLVSDLAGRGPIRWLKVVLEGRASNRSGLGAAVRVVAGGRTLVQWQDGKSGHLSQSVLPLYFGLGDAAAVDRVEVQWPSGRAQVVRGVTPNSTLRVTEPAN